MILFRRIIPFASSVLAGAFLSGLLFNPLEWRWWIAGCAAVVCASIAVLTLGKNAHGSFLQLLFPLLLLCTGGLGAFFFISSILYQTVFLLVLVVLIGVYIETVFIYLYHPQKYSALSMPNFTFIIHVISVFLLAAFGFALHLVRLVPGWALVVVGIVVVSMVMAHILLLYKVWDRKHVFLVVIPALLTAELVWALQFWPTAYFVNGIIIAIMLYCVAALIQQHLREVQTKRTVIQTVSISILALLIVVSTSQWT